MKVWQVEREWSIDALELVDRPEPEPGPGQVVVRMRAASLNYRDLLTVTGQGGAYRLPLIPFSDGAGEIAAVGAGVSRVAVGDRVCPMFFQSWFDGGPSASGRRLALGGTRPGVLQELLLLDAEGVSRIPDHLSFVEAATLPCAGLTAWRSLFDEAHLRPGQTVLVQGTGGVSIFALQFAKLAGTTVIVTSSSDEKLERAKALGADHTINYRAVAEWGKAAADWAGGGVDHVVEVGGKDTFAQSIEAARVGGTILVIGVLSGFSQQISIPSLFSKNLHVIGLSVGSRKMFENMAAAIGQNRMKPVIDRTLGFTEVPDALRLMQQAGHFGKITIAFP
ncbi:NAD(P)-dependent alcohol dehydrogenase [Bradyrhizobium sp. AUGA SZCCT0240]|uniref:zinc-dependent alcohol dehydrogenase family protein n=1 Tax=unclassified Bradyrhizobium TaxID=2631580 RepID=UPI001BAC196D|nr:MULTISPECIES: NAD(P)-dependent alcohol dehydrogenase [unclassified Bradyrhizobium]MBR1199267.1 NAD(P)-dependent alcohol dehydrogenase [Bradyrhizobium sp. AUGA SZCCT0158]MBR1239908.1 NAD(P)-dependent alcohol dehydrogenase [Bradyrhizobium sp. AUGA SZCCT0274]MBR1257349.1 NAD(P)-dependent alcohol dehydrogenase [Bradyrhizobium sp. AUGA SZCCT0240]